MFLKKSIFFTFSRTTISLCLHLCIVASVSGVPSPTPTTSTLAFTFTLAYCYHPIPCSSSPPLLPLSITLEHPLIIVHHYCHALVCHCRDAIKALSWSPRPLSLLQLALLLLFCPLTSSHAIFNDSTLFFYLLDFESLVLKEYNLHSLMPLIVARLEKQSNSGRGYGWRIMWWAIRREGTRSSVVAIFFPSIKVNDCDAWGEFNRWGFTVGRRWQGKDDEQEQRRYMWAQWYLWTRATKITSEGEDILETEARQRAELYDEITGQRQRVKR